MPNRFGTSDPTRATLLLRLKQDGPEREVAWGEFHSLYAPVISGFARRTGVPPQDVDDLVQEVFQALLSAAPGFRYDASRGRFRAYLKTCVCHKVAEFRRRRGRAGHYAAALETADPSAIAADAVWEDVWETEKLGRALAAVRQRYATNAERRRTFRAFEMCCLLDRPADQVAAELSLSVESVRAAKSRVSRALREAFDGMDELDA